MKFYVATALENVEEQKRVVTALLALGHECSYDWSVHGSVQRDGPERIREVAVNELRGVLDADLVVVLLPGGRGTHTELGFALACSELVTTKKKYIILVGPGEDASGRLAAFYLHPRVDRWFEDSDLLIAYLTGVHEASLWQFTKRSPTINSPCQRASSDDKLSADIS
jgi:hypothetical protein